MTSVISQLFYRPLNLSTQARFLNCSINNTDLLRQTQKNGVSITFPTSSSRIDKCSIICLGQDWVEPRLAKGGALQDVNNKRLWEPNT